MTSALFTPIRLAEIEFANRIVVSPMCQYSADDGCAGDWHMTHLGMLANSGAGLLVVEATAVERRGRITHGDLGLYNDHCEAALARVVDHCRRIGTAKLGIQIAHAGRKASAQAPWEGGRALGPDEDPWQTIAPSAIPFRPDWHTPSEMTRADMNRVRDAHAEAARLADRFRRNRGPRRARLPAARVPLPALEPPHGRVWRKPRGTYAVSARSRRGGP